MIAKFIEFVKAKFNDIMLFIIVVLLILLAFASGYMVAKQESKPPIQIQNGTHT